MPSAIEVDGAEKTTPGKLGSRWRVLPPSSRMLPIVIGGHDAALRLGIFRSMNQRVSWNRRRFPLGHGPFANDTFCKTTGDLATLRKRHGIQCATMGTKEGTSRRDSSCQRHGTPPFVQSNCTPGKECVLELNRTRLAHVAGDVGGGRIGGTGTGCRLPQFPVKSGLCGGPRNIPYRNERRILNSGHAPTPAFL